jgi:hypothetical protein
MTWGLTLQCGVGGGAGEKFCSKRWVRIKIEGVEECCDASMAIDEAQRLISTIRLGVCSMSLAEATLRTSHNLTIMTFSPFAI